LWCHFCCRLWCHFWCHLWCRFWCHFWCHFWWVKFSNSHIPHHDEL
jgi:hypothetical protein